MINFKVFEQARQKHPRSEAMPFMAELRQQMRSHQPYQGLRLLHHIHLTIETVFKVEPLLLAGAELTVSCPNFIKPNPEAVEILLSANVEVNLEGNFEDNYDICLDLYGELPTLITPSQGVVELTKLDNDIYQSLDIPYPLISVDDSSLKNIETFYGTSKAFVKAFHQLTNESLVDKNLIIFGCGKVGKGLVNELLGLTKELVIVDKNPKILEQLRARGIKGLQAEDLDGIRAALKEAFCVVTCTGVNGVLSKEYDLEKEDFSGKYLANIGAEDEFGDNFSEAEVLFKKAPINFSLAEPTPVQTLDPVFYAHNIAIDLILSNKLEPGYHSFPSHLAQEIIEKWGNYHDQDIAFLRE
ncbi:MAG: hypothetical protein F6J94_14275 [Moorea sp. SIO1F2]|uniref:adenosylhomocysteinase n=1 Tax=Moorena sp. SIO1F2 TaxID=2607819 RepID=UPI0013BE2C2D|nr:adenosylhomocysteinase [Moorena sp. SIO1F2]NET83049.1 hypothetical protein [Moorena sp. SIO1F2]